MSNRVMLMDLYNLLHRNVYVHQNLSHGGIFTGGVYGMISTFCSAYLRYRPDKSKVFLCTDTRPYLRTKLYPEYKANRIKPDSSSAENVDHTLELTQEFFNILGVPTVYGEGLEADDIIALLVEAYPDDEIYILSGDSDLVQVLRSGVTLVKSSEKLYTLEDFNKDYPTLEPKQWANVTALTGGHNGVPGLKRVGIARAYMYVIGGKISEGISKRIEDFKSQYEDNLLLTTLPITHDVPLSFCLDRFTDYKNVEQLLSVLGINVTPAMDEVFRDFV